MSNVFRVLTVIEGMLELPCADEPLNLLAAAEFFHDREGFVRRCRDWIQGKVDEDIIVEYGEGPDTDEDMESEIGDWMVIGRQDKDVENVSNVKRILHSFEMGPEEFERYGEEYREGDEVDKSDDSRAEKEGLEDDETTPR